MLVNNNKTPFLASLFFNVMIFQSKKMTLFKFTVLKHCITLLLLII